PSIAFIKCASSSAGLTTSRSKPTLSRAPRAASALPHSEFRKALRLARDGDSAGIQITVGGTAWQINDGCLLGAACSRLPAFKVNGTLPAAAGRDLLNAAGHPLLDIVDAT